MKKLMRMPGRRALALAIGLAFSAPAVYGAGLGRITVHSALGQPLRAEVEVTSVSRDEAASLAVKLASVAAFRQANLEYNPALSGLRVSLGQRTDAGYVIRIASPSAINEPYLDLLLELTSSTGRVMREYTILLDPPALRAATEVVAPATGRAAAPAAARPTAPVAAAPAAPRAGAPAVSGAPVGSTYEVRRGDTLGGIAEKTRPSSASLDQMLVAIFRANPEAFIAENMNNLRAGSVLKLPGEQQVLAVDGSAARREVAAQSADFARYRSRLAQAATEAGPAAAAAAGQGKVTTRVEDASAAAPAGDQLKIAQAPATRSADEAVARDRQIRDLLDRVAELERTNQQLQKALELQSKTGAQVQATAEGKPGAAEPTPPVAPSAAPTAAAPPAAAPVPSAAPVTPPAAEPPKAEAPKAPPPPAAEEPGLLSSLVGPNLPLVAGLGVVLAGLIGYSVYRRRKPDRDEEDFGLGAEAAHGNSLFGQSGGRSVDTGAVSTFNSSFIPAATQVDASDVDPVAEADVYIAYGREEQAEDILKEALRVQPDRHPARVKLMEILARRGDKPGFLKHASDLMTRTSGTGEDWERAAAIGRSIDPTNSMFTASTAAMAEMIRRDTMSELNLETDAPHRLGAETGGLRAPPATLGGEATALDASTPAGRRERQGADSVSAGDSSLRADTVLPLESRSGTEAPTVSGATASGPRAPADLSALEFESMTTMPSTRMMEPEPEPATKTARAAAPDEDKPLDFDFGLPPAAASKASMVPELPDLDLNLPPSPAPATQAGARAPTKEAGADLSTAGPATAGAFPTTSGPATTGGQQRTRPAPLEDTLLQPTLLGGLTAALPEGSTRLMSNTDQATVPLIDFDLTGAELPPTTRPGAAGALTGSQMASQMATKLDLARGYIDLGVKDGARELLEEVMRDGTREQRQAAIELMKQIER